jgi:hypothetical protein
MACDSGISRPPFPMITPNSTAKTDLTFSRFARTVFRNRHTFMVAVDPLRNLDMSLSCFNVARRGLQEVEWLLRNLVVQLVDVSDVVSADTDDVSAGFRKGRHVGGG